MNRDKLDKLLARYYKGESSIEEEFLLKEYFLNTLDIPHIYRADKQLFETLYRWEKSIKKPLTNNVVTRNNRLRDFENELDQRIELEKIENSNMKKSRVKRLYPIIGAVATLILITCTYFIFRTQTTPSNSYTSHTSYTTNVQESAKLTEYVLRELSTQLNKGVEGIKKVDHKVEDINRIIDKIKKKK